MQILIVVCIGLIHGSYYVICFYYESKDRAPISSLGGFRAPLKTLLGNLQVQHSGMPNVIGHMGISGRIQELPNYS